MNESNLVSQKLQIKLKFKYTAWFFVLDQILRFLLLIAYLQDYLQKIHFLVSQYLLLFVVALIYNQYKNKLERKYSSYINIRYRSENPKITINEETLHYYYNDFLLVKWPDRPVIVASGHL